MLDTRLYLRSQGQLDRSIKAKHRKKKHTKKVKRDGANDGRTKQGVESRKGNKKVRFWVFWSCQIL